MYCIKVKPLITEFHCKTTQSLLLDELQLNFIDKVIPHINKIRVLTFL